jgi:hypothetical protein
LEGREGFPPRYRPPKFCAPLSLARSANALHSIPTLFFLHLQARRSRRPRRAAARLRRRAAALVRSFDVSRRECWEHKIREGCFIFRHTNAYPQLFPYSHQCFFSPPNSGSAPQGDRCEPRAGGSVRTPERLVRPEPFPNGTDQDAWERAVADGFFHDGQMVRVAIDKAVSRFVHSLRSKWASMS